MRRNPSFVMSLVSREFRSLAAVMGYHGLNATARKVVLAQITGASVFCCVMADSTATKPDGLPLGSLEDSFRVIMRRCGEPCLLYTQRVANLSFQDIAVVFADRDAEVKTRQTFTHSTMSQFSFYSSSQKHPTALTDAPWER